MALRCLAVGCFDLCCIALQLYLQRRSFLLQISLQSKAELVYIEINRHLEIFVPSCSGFHEAGCAWGMFELAQAYGRHCVASVFMSRTQAHFAVLDKMAFQHGAAIWLAAKPVLEVGTTPGQGPEQDPCYKLQLNLRFSYHGGCSEASHRHRPKSVTQGPLGYSLEQYSRGADQDLPCLELGYPDDLRF